MDREAVFTVEEALEQLRDKIGYDGSWAELSSYLPRDWRMDPQRRRSATAAHFAAVLELVKSGRAELRQSGTFEPLEIRGRSGEMTDTGISDAGLFEVPPLAEQERMVEAVLFASRRAPDRARDGSADAAWLRPGRGVAACCANAMTGAA
jgi:hypothetical protein